MCRKQFLAQIGHQTEDSKMLYEDFMPLALEQNKERQAIFFDSFDAALDEYFSRVRHNGAHFQELSWTLV